MVWIHHNNMVTVTSNNNKTFANHIIDRLTKVLTNDMGMNSLF
jgi:hypothetical protein